MNSFKEFEQNAWERKASLYEQGWGAVTSQATARIIEIAQIVPGTKLLDIGCGPGHFCNLANQKGAETTGCDLSKEMVQIAKNHYPAISFAAEDAENLTFLDSTFNVVTLNYLLLHVPNQKKVLLEAKRVLKNEGLLTFALWQEPSKSAALKLIFDSIKNFADTSVIPPADDLFQFARPETAKSFLAANGFIDFTATIVGTAWKTPSPESFFLSVLSGTRMGGTIELQEPEIREKIKSKIFGELEQFKTPTGYFIPMPSVIICGRKSD